MINITRLIKVEGTPPYQVLVNTNATYTVEERINSIYSINLVYENEAEIGLRDSVTVIDAFGCIKSIPLLITNVCDDFVVSSITRVVGGGNTNQTSLGSSATYEVTSNQEIDVVWTLDDPEYYEMEILSDSVILTQLLSGLQQTNLRATITNENGCVEERRFTLFPCRTLAQPSIASLILQDDGTYKATRVSLRASTSCDATIDWSTLIITNNTSLVITRYPGQPYIDIVSQTPVEDARIYFTVASTDNVRSNRSYVSTIVAENQTTVEDSEELGIAPLTYPITSSTNSLNISTTSLAIPTDVSVVGIINSLTTTNSTNFDNGIITADMTGLDVASIGIDLEDSTGPINPSVINVIRKLPPFDAGTIEVLRTPTTYDIKAGTTYNALNIVAGNGSLSGDVLTKAGSNEAVTVEVTNASSQRSNLIVYICGQEPELVNVNICEATVNPYDYFDNVSQDGVWATNNGSPLPATFNGPVTFNSTGTFAYTYTSPNSIGDYDCSATDVNTLTIVRSAQNAVANDDCATATQLATVSGPTTLLSSGTILNDCVSQTTFSGSTGNLTAKLYDQWFTYPFSHIQGVTVITTITITGINAQPINMPSIQVWDNCSTPTAGVIYSQTLNSATASINENGGISGNRLFQVLSDTTGDFRIEITQTYV